MAILAEGAGISPMRQRRKFEPAFKAKAVLVLLRGDKTMTQLCREHEIGVDLLGQWRKVVIEHAAEFFAEPKRTNGEAVRLAELERPVGQQAMELSMANWKSPVVARCEWIGGDPRAARGEVGIGTPRPISPVCLGLGAAGP
jgi:transposase-like protein